MKKEWDLFVEQSKTPLFFFKRDFLEYHADRFIDSSLVCYSDNKLVAIFPATKSDQYLISHGGLTYGGLIVSEKLRAELINDVLVSIIEKARELHVTKITYKAIPHIFYTQGAQEDLYFLTNNFKAQLIRRDLSSVIYLDNRLKPSKGRKWLIARAKKMELQVTSSNNYTDFYQLLSDVLIKHGTKPIHSSSELEYLAKTFPNNISLKVIEKDNELLAAVWLFQFNSVVHTQYMATNEQGKELGALDLLLESCIEESQKNGLKYFSFGISTEQQGTFLNQGLIAQKEGFGARGIALDFYEITL